MGMFYPVAAPISNREYFSARALFILREAACIAAEDTRTTGIDASWLKPGEHSPVLLQGKDGNPVLFRISDRVRKGEEESNNPGCPIRTPPLCEGRLGHDELSWMPDYYPWA